MNKFQNISPQSQR